MKFKNLSILFLFLFTTPTFANGSCESVLNWAALVDPAVLYCREGCNVFNVLSSVSDKEDKPNKIHINIQLIAENTELQTYEILVTKTDNKSNSQVISKYEAITDTLCFLQKMTRIK